MSYEAMRQFADSWGLLFMGFVFLAFVAWTFRPGARDHHRSAATSILKEDEDG